jgi:hypothetical protein
MQEHVEQAIGALLGAAAAIWGWVWHVRTHPWMNCRWCEGSGKRRTRVFGLLADRFGRCRWCKGTGRRLRLSARLAGYDVASGRKR